MIARIDRAPGSFFSWRLWRAGVRFRFPDDGFGGWSTHLWSGMRTPEYPDPLITAQPHQESMATTLTITESRPGRSDRPARGAGRQTVELLVCLALCVIVVRTFSAEAYVVPTGSMAPTLLGWHRELVCPNCQYPFDVGIDEDGHAGPSVCPNCGEAGLDSLPAVECGGDRVLVQKFLYDFRTPKRWEVAVFH